MNGKKFRLLVVLMPLCMCGLSQARENNKLTITGRVVDYMAGPVGGAEVLIYEGEYFNGEYLLKTIAPIVKTNQQGYFEQQADVSSQYDTFIVARKEGLALAWDGLNYSSNTKGKGHFLLVLERACTLTGEVVDHNGKAVSGAKVQAQPKTSYLSRLRQRPIIAPKEWLTAETNSQGMFYFNQFAADVSCDFWIKAPEVSCTYQFTTHDQPCCGFEVWRSDIRLVMPREGKIKGRVVEAETGRPVGGVELIIRPGGDRGDILNRYCARTISADADGVFLCTGLAEGRHKIELATIEDETAQWIAEPVEVNIVPDKFIDDIRVLAKKGGIIECSVRESGIERPLSQMQVRAYNETFRARSITNETGIARLRVLPGDYKAYASGQGYIYWRVNEPVVVKDGEVTHVDVFLDKSPIVSGIVANANGRPAEDILVTIHPFGDHVYTGERGQFQAGYDEKRTGRGLIIMARDSERSLAAVLLTKEFEKPAQLSLVPALTVKGKVAGPNGAGIPAARVLLCIDFANCLSWIGAEVLADSEGRFEFKAVPPKRDDYDYRISVNAAGFAPKTYDRISIEGQAGATADVGVVQLMPANLSVSGTVVDANGLPDAQAIIFINGLDGIDQPNKNTATNEMGRFTLKGIRKGPIRLQANFSSSPGGAGFLSAQAGDKDVKIVLGQKLVHSRHKSLVGNPLPQFADFGIGPSQIPVDNKAILICFFDMNQRPSRNCIMQIAKKARQIEQNDTIIVAVQTSKVEQNALNEWIKKYNIPLPVGTITGDENEIRSAWGIRALPWLILTDSRHIVRVEGFALAELDDNLKANK